MIQRDLVNKLLPAEMNASNGAQVASIAGDDAELAEHVQPNPDTT